MDPVALIQLLASPNHRLVPLFKHIPASTIDSTWEDQLLSITFIRETPKDTPIPLPSMHRTVGCRSRDGVINHRRSQLSPSPGHSRRIEHDDAAPRRKPTRSERPNTMRGVTQAFGQTSNLAIAPISDRPPIQQSSPSADFATSRPQTALRLPPVPG